MQTIIFKKLQKKVIKSLIISSILLVLTACSTEKKLNEVLYNNTWVALINTMSGNIEASAVQYNEKIPSPLNETMSLDLSTLKENYEQALTTREVLEKTKMLKSKNEKQESLVLLSIKDYLNTVDAYLKIYSEILDFYDSEAYKDALENVSIKDEALHKAYIDFIEKNNTLVETLDSFVIKE